MGGGALMRAATVASGNSICSGFRHMPASAVSETMSAAVLRKRPAQTPPIVSAAVQSPPPLDADGWVLAGGVEEMDPTPRVVFAGVPTIEEATEATLDLKDALEKVYFSKHNANEFEGLTSAESNHSSSPSLKNVGTLITNGCASQIPSVPKPAYDAICLLNESPAVQKIVASVVCDEKVWDAVLGNEEVMEFFKSQNSVGLLCQDLDNVRVESCKVNEDATLDDGELSQISSVTYSTEHSETSGNGFTRLIGKIKAQIASMVSNLHIFFQNVFRNHAGDFCSADSDAGAEGGFSRENTLGASIFALAILAVMVVLLKRF